MPIEGIKINDPGVVISCLRRNGSMNRQGSRRRDPGHQEVTDNLASTSNQSGHALNGTNWMSEEYGSVCLQMKRKWLNFSCSSLNDNLDACCTSRSASRLHIAWDYKFRQAGNCRNLYLTSDNRSIESMRFLFFSSNKTWCTYSFAIVNQIAKAPVLHEVSAKFRRNQCSTYLL